MGGIPPISEGVAGIGNLLFLSTHQKTAFEYSKDTLQLQFQLQFLDST